ncbi:MAG: hypothetical protein HY718_08990, partial [Planctomycetes bacterium]|nr:hypothetical protein [Planctomycetota bacterium]
MTKLFTEGAAMARILGIMGSPRRNGNTHALEQSLACLEMRLVGQVLVPGVAERGAVLG